jgi:protein-S-isoprenylcysteine O-methyltransferase Ste14
VESGVYRYLRHPIYAGLVLAGLGWGLVTAAPAAIALTLLLLVWLDLKARREEAWLAARHPGYEAYRARTRKFLPFVY